ncbi:addiction module toxin RelE [Pasteurellaceae bacterium Pebbles2]|nr:addiction module toxin RelE [Pasteurellaceae bacterium Pebbles2]
MPLIMMKKSTKRANLPRQSQFHKTFVKDWKRLNQSGRYNMLEVKKVMALLIANDEPLPSEYLDHALKGEYSDTRECHIGGDFLLIYLIDEPQNLIIFLRLGTHAELFK